MLHCFIPLLCFSILSHFIFVILILYKHRDPLLSLYNTQCLSGEILCTYMNVLILQLTFIHHYKIKTAFISYIQQQLNSTNFISATAITILPATNTTAASNVSISPLDFQRSATDHCVDDRSGNFLQTGCGQMCACWLHT